MGNRRCMLLLPAEGIKAGYELDIVTFNFATEESNQARNLQIWQIF